MTRTEILRVLDAAAAKVGWTDGATSKQRYALACRLEELDITPADIGIDEDISLDRFEASRHLDDLKAGGPR